MNAPKPTPEKKLEQDLETFQKLPAKAQELELLRDRSEKATGKEGLVLDKKIEATAKQDAKG